MDYNRSSVLRLFIWILISGSILSCSKPNNFELEEITIEDIHNGIRSGSCSCESLVQAYIGRIETYDQKTNLNAITLVNENALITARDLDLEFQNSGKLRALHCVPLIVKDNYEIERMRTTAGSLTLENNISSRDAFQIMKLKEAGAIMLGRSNMAEWAFSPRVTISSTAGETLNPYNLEHVPAGSSGGTAAAVAANFGVAGLGTDTGNSIRGPSSHNALVGFRSTLGLTSRDGIVPLYLRNDVGGPMTRTVTDATKILEVIAGYDPKDPITVYSKGKVSENYSQYLNVDGLQNARIGVLRILTDGDINPEIKRLFEIAIEDLKKAGAEIIDPIKIPDFDSLRTDQWCSTFRQDVNSYLNSLGNTVEVKNLEDIIETGKYSDYIEDRLRHFMSNEDTIQFHSDGSPCADPYTDTRRIAFRNAIETAMDKNNVGAIIYPSWNYPAAEIGDLEGYRGDNSQIIAPHTGQPAFTVPMGYVSGNLPAGLQFLGKMYDEPTLISYTYAYEQATHHRKPPERFPELVK